MDVQLTRAIAGSLLLLVIVLLPVRRESGRRFAFLGFLLGTVVTLSVTSLVLHLGDFVLVDSGADTVKFQFDHLREAEAAHIPKNMIVIEGSSQTALGLDTAAVETSLREAGYDVVVLEIAGMGGNHLERYAGLKMLAHEIRRHDLSLSPNTRLMLEVSPGYDEAPARFIDLNRHSLRVYNYASVDTIVFTLHAYQITHAPIDAARQNSLNLLVQHALGSALHIGLLPYEQRFDSLEDTAVYAGMQDHIRAFTPYDPDEFVDAPVQQLKPVWFNYAAYRAAKISDLFDGAISGVGYFSVPVLPIHKNVPRYVHAFCLEHGPGPCVDATDPAIYGSLDEARYHFNRDHLSAEGAAIYSRYFAQQLIAQGVVTK